MGFAGQVFAARVAIGLAVPSPQALNKTGGVLARAITNIQKRIELARGRGDISGKYAAEMDKSNKKALSLTDKMNNQIVARMKTTLSKINAETKGSMAQSASALSSNYSKIQSILGKDLGDKLTQGMKTGKSFHNVTQLAGNLHKMNEEERQAVVTHLQMYIGQENKRIQNLYKEAELMERKTIPQKEAYNLAIKEAEKAEDQLLTQKELLGDIKERIQLSKQLTAEYDFMSKNVSELAEGVIDVTNAVRSQFNSALRTSVAILTAVGYKLNQNTQDLVEFERELLNANSVFNLTNDNLFEVGNSIIEFGNNFGIAVQNGATGLYQLASAGLEANEALEVLPHTLKLSMAVQGDHNTISKLTAQTLFGFGMEMDQAALITDKFAYAIQKSLIEYQDLSSAVKFALPFFTSTGQSIDQLLGALQILTNRALEAGIAGRGLRQALAEFAESAMDAEVGFRKMGVEILNAEGEMLQLTEIASQFAAAVGPETASNTELLTTLIQDLNVRGATAFIHLVQASDEFTQAVEDTTNAGGQLDEMVRIQNESLGAQLQILKTNIFSIFALRDASYEGTEYINAFHKAVVDSVQGFKDMIIVTENGEQRLTEFGQQLQDMSTEYLIEIVEIVKNLIMGIKDLLPTVQRLWQVILVPLRIIDRLLNSDSKLVQGLLVFAATWKALSFMGIPQLLAAMGSGLMRIGAVNTMVTGAGAAVASGATSAGLATGLLVRQGATSGTLKKGYEFVGKNMIKGPKGGLMKVGSKASMRAFVPGIAARGSLAFLGPLGAAIGAGLLGYELLKLGGVLQSGGYVQPMAGGGSMGGGRPYLVGEQGPELFMPGNSGQMLNTGQTQDLLGGRVVLKDVSIGIDSFGGIA